MRECSSCKQEKQPSDFWPDKRRKSGLMARCKSCKANDARAYRELNPEVNKARYWSNPQGERERHLVRKYGVTQADYERMLANQSGGCAICHKKQDRAFDVDHDHSSGLVRGLLCTSCNRMLGHAGDSADNLESGASYLRSFAVQARTA